MRYGVAVKPTICQQFRIQDTHRQCYGFIVIFTKMVTRLYFIALVQLGPTNQITNLFLVTGGRIIGRDRNIAHTEGIPNNGLDFVCFCIANQATHIKVVARMLSDNTDIALHRDSVHVANFVTYTAQTTNICNLNIRGRYGSCFFCSILDQDIGTTSIHIIKYQ